jgi:hypothetical protein
LFEIGFYLSVARQGKNKERKIILFPFFFFSSYSSPFSSSPSSKPSGLFRLQLSLSFHLVFRFPVLPI